MSTPSTLPLDDFDPASRDAPEPSDELPPGIETDHDARILDEIEASLRAIIEGEGGTDRPDRLSDVTRAAAQEIAEQQHADAPAIDEIAVAGQHPAERPSEGSLRDPFTPPWLLARSLEPLTIPDPLPPLPETWPYTRRRRSNKIFLRLGLAATGAAVVAAIAVKDIPAIVMQTVRGPVTELSTNAAAVFNEGKATRLQDRLDAMQRDERREAEPATRLAAIGMQAQTRAVPAKSEPAASIPEPQRETVMLAWPAPDTTKRTEPTGWHVSPPQHAPATEAAASATAGDAAPAANPSPTRSLNAEEIAMLRKMGDDYISNGDFVGARGVLERAADAGDASAAFAIASTYDPVVLARFKVRGLEPDIVKASFWYERARELGSSEAPHRLQQMMAARAN